ncbi:MAG: haloacid dehalogenase-like hydrolase, partial [Proteobacteria bacterium]|nr:haloacid dehalogenase-like hydrolase [Pseudomonadota bacterium]
MIIVVDLDKTLLKVDSYPRWIFFHLRHALFSNPLLFLYLFWLTSKRALKFIGHQRFKHKAMKLLDKSDLNELFAKEISTEISPEVTQFIKSHDGARLVLSTAAPAQYVQHLTLHLPVKFEATFCSRLESHTFFDNSRDNKVLSFQDKFNNEPCSLFITDHHDDLPMMKLSLKNILVNPSETTLRVVKNA